MVLLGKVEVLSFTERMFAKSESNDRLPVELSSFVLSAGAGLIADLTHALEFHGRPLLGRPMRLEVSQQRDKDTLTLHKAAGNDMEHGISFLTL
ncbi:hypothetical protein HID58_067581 [Brassica napus]|uniref:Uncharacterized protein n=1 Tax=Brassica napus TaxID=3708 RepID=A0ABQ7ZIW5_BRANA|nr:hypothetical protein HID58_067581 [Brassica napus]